MVFKYFIIESHSGSELYCASSLEVKDHEEVCEICHMFAELLRFEFYANDDVTGRKHTARSGLQSREMTQSARKPFLTLSVALDLML